MGGSGSGNRWRSGVKSTTEDYRTLDVPAESNGEACRLACEGDNQCRAWTYLRPGYVDSGARCYLKNRLTPPRHRPCCISGVER